MIRRGPNFRPPPRALVASVAAKAQPDFWRKFSTGIDAAIGKANATLVNWYRDEAHNTRVGGQIDSQHRYGTAVDIVPDDPREIAPIMSRLRQLSFFVLYHRGHIHAQAFPKGALGRAGVRPG